MPCYHPKKAFVLGLNKETNNKILKITDYDCKCIKQIKGNTNKSQAIKIYEHPCVHALNCGEKLCDFKCGRFQSRFEEDSYFEYIYEFLTIPCGQCLGCRIDYSRQWACRMMLELPYCDSSCFITLTYDDDHLTDEEISWNWLDRNGRLRAVLQQPNLVEHVDYDSGEICSYKTLNRGRKSDLTQFLRRLRKQFGEGIRFYACAEYGEKSKRPHYHAIIFNFDFPDKKLRNVSPDGKFSYYVSDTLADLWPFGYHLIADVSYETCAYVARYVTKKAKGLDADEYRSHGMEPEYSQMSRRPGIGRRWFDEHGEDAYNTYIINVLGKKYVPPRYFDLLYQQLDFDGDGEQVSTLHLDRLQEIKDLKVEKAVSSNRMKLDNCDYDFLKMLEVEEYNFSHNPFNKFGLKRKDL